MLGLRSFNIVLVGPSFPTEQIEVSDFTLHGKKLQTIARVPQLIHAKVDEYTLHVLPDRFQLSADAPKATGYRIEALTSAAKTFITEYSSKRTLTAIGHNFVGAFDLPGKTAGEFLKSLAYPAWFSDAIGAHTGPQQSLMTKFTTADGKFIGLRLEPSSEDQTQLLYDINVAWGLGSAIAIPPDAFQAIDNYNESFAAASSLIDRLADAEIPSP